MDRFQLAIDRGKLFLSLVSIGTLQLPSVRQTWDRTVDYVLFHCILSNVTVSFAVSEKVICVPDLGMWDWDVYALDTGKLVTFKQARACVCDSRKCKIHGKKGPLFCHREFDFWEKKKKNE